MVIVFLCTRVEFAPHFRKVKKRALPLLHGTQSMGTVFWVYATHTRIHTKHTHGHWGPSLHSSLKIWTGGGGAWPITFEPIKGEVLEQTRIKGGVAIVLEFIQIPLNTMTWFVGMWYFYSFKRTRLEPNYIKKICAYSHASITRVTRGAPKLWSMHLV